MVIKREALEVVDKYNFDGLYSEEITFYARKKTGFLTSKHKWSKIPGKMTIKEAIMSDLEDFFEIGGFVECIVIQINLSFPQQLESNILLVIGEPCEPYVELI